MAASVVMLSRLLSTCQQSSAAGRYSNRSSALRTHEGRGSATITSSDVEKTGLGKLSDDEIWAVLAYIKTHWKSRDVLDARAEMLRNSERR